MKSVRGHASLARLGLSLCVLFTGCSRAERAPTQAVLKEVSAPSASLPRSVASAAPSASASAQCVTPESVGVSALGNLSGQNTAENAAIAAARHELTRVLEVPSDYFGSVQTAGDLVLLELWHRSSFPPESCVPAGSSGGKRRTLSYDLRKQRIVSSKVWEPDGEAEPDGR